MKLITVLRKEYPDFWQFCRSEKAVMSEQLTEHLYEKYRAATGQTEEYTDGIKAKIREAETARERLVCDVLGVELLDAYRDIPVKDVRFGVRIGHFFQLDGIKTLYDVLSSRDLHFREARNLGQTSVAGMYDSIKTFFAGGTVPVKAVKDSAAGKDLAKRHVTLYEEPVWLKDEEDPDLEKAVQASPAAGIVICAALQNFYRPVFEYYKSVRNMMQILSALPDYIQNCPSGTLVAAYGLRFPEKAGALSAWPKEQTLPAVLLHEAHEDPAEPADWIPAANALCKWLQNMDPAKTAARVFSKHSLEAPGYWQNYADKYWDLAVSRAGGERLVNLGKAYGLTRERARQIEANTLQRFMEAYSNAPYDLVSVLHIRTGRNLITFESAEDLLGEPGTQLLWHMAKKHMLDCELYEYSTLSRAICWNSVTGTPEDIKNITAAVQSMPSFYEDEKPACLAAAEKQYSIPAGILDEWLQYTHRKYGQLYTTSRPDVAKKCEYLLRCCFKDGYKVGDRDMAKTAIRMLSEIFSTGPGTTPRYLDARMSVFGQLVDRGLYMYPGYVDIDYSVLQDLFAYIEKSASGIVLYNELYEVFKDKLHAAGITNRYMLQGAIKRCGCPYTVTRDYILKGEAGSMAEELSAFAKEKGRFTVKEFSEAFPYYNSNLLYPLASRTDDVIQIGPSTFMDATRLDYTPVEWMDIQSFIYGRISPSGVDTEAVFAEFLNAFGPFCARNGLDSSQALYYVLEYMYRDYFTFTRPKIYTA